MCLLGDDIVPKPQVVTNHAITVDASPTACGHGWCRWAGAAPVGTPPTGSTRLVFPLELAQCKPDHPGAAAHIARRLHSRRGPADQVRAHRGGAGARSGHSGPLYESSAAELARRGRPSTGHGHSCCFPSTTGGARSLPRTRSCYINGTLGT